jgi:hypothetical protein
MFASVYPASEKKTFKAMRNAVFRILMYIFLMYPDPGIRKTYKCG